MVAIIQVLLIYGGVRLADRYAKLHRTEQAQAPVAISSLPKEIPGEERIGMPLVKAISEGIEEFKLMCKEFDEGIRSVSKECIDSIANVFSTGALSTSEHRNVTAEDFATQVDDFESTVDRLVTRRDLEAQVMEMISK